jgi:hypothetical protein
MLFLLFKDLRKKNLKHYNTGMVFGGYSVTPPFRKPYTTVKMAPVHHNQRSSESRGGPRRALNFDDVPVVEVQQGRIRHAWAERQMLCRTLNDYMWEDAADLMLERGMPIGSVLNVSVFYSHAFDHTTVHTLKRVADNGFVADCYSFDGQFE